MLGKEVIFAENLFPAYAGTTRRVTQGGREEEEPPLDPAASELGEEEGEGRLPRSGGWWGERPPAAGGRGL